MPGARVRPVWPAQHVACQACPVSTVARDLLHSKRRAKLVFVHGGTGPATQHTLCQAGVRRTWHGTCYTASGVPSWCSSAVARYLLHSKTRAKLVFVKSPILVT